MDLTDRLRFIHHAGHRILYFDLTEIDRPDTVLPVLERAKALVRQEPARSVLTLTNVRNLRFNASGVAAFKAMVEHNRPYIRASAVVGLSPLHRVIYMAVVRLAGRTIPTFDDEASAKAWLVGQATAGERR